MITVNGSEPCMRYRITEEDEVAKFPVVKVKDLTKHPDVDQWVWDSVMDKMGEKIVARCVGVRQVPVLCPHPNSGALVIHFQQHPILQMDDEVLAQVGRMLGIQREEEDSVGNWSPPDTEGGVGEWEIADPDAWKP